VTPEYCREMDDKYIEFHNETLAMTKMFLKEQIEHLKNFNKAMIDRFIENKVPMSTYQSDFSQSLYSSFVNTWTHTVLFSEQVHGYGKHLNSSDHRVCY
ncbi:hypothetical protein PMAYCL1PPCAC_19880, partial [Pristionchus mayeri]